MRYMGIDFGSKRIGIALSDEGNTVAFPNSVLASGPGLIEEVGILCAKNDVTAIVLGESKDYQGNYNKIMAKAFEFKNAAERELKLPVIFEPEFLTSAQAERQGDTSMLDASAAALILQSYLDKINATHHDQH
jgi:putative Holliday junction resolvase